MAMLLGGFGGLGQGAAQAQMSIQNCSFDHQGRRGTLSQLFDDSPFRKVSRKDRTILEELQQETDAWLKDIDL